MSASSHHGVVVMCYILANFVDIAATDNGNLFLEKERGFTRSQVQLMMATTGLGGFLMQCVAVPLWNLCNIGPYLLLCVALIASVAHVATYAFVTDPTVFTVAMPLGAFPFVVTLTVTAIVSGRESDSSNAAVRDQGTLIGTLTGIKLLASCVSPFVLEACTNNWRSFPVWLRTPGIGFCIFAALLLPAVLGSLILYLRRIQARSKHGDDNDDASLIVDSVS